MALTPSPYDTSFNGNDYNFIVRLYNGVNDIYLKPESWDELYLEEDIFDWYTKGSIVIKSPNNTLERSSPEANNYIGVGDENLIYKFRNDGRDTIFISIIPKPDPNVLSMDYPENLWRIEIEAIVFDIQDYTHSSMENKQKKLYFIEKTFQLMAEKNIEFTTANVGSNNTNTNIYKLNNHDRSLRTGEAIKELLSLDKDFQKNMTLSLSDETQWDLGSDDNKVFYTSSSDSKFNEDLDYLLKMHTSSKEDDYQPAIFKLERPEKQYSPRQFSLKSLKTYFSKAGNSQNVPGEYQLEHFFIQENDQDKSGQIAIIKSPISNNLSLTNDVKSGEYGEVTNYQLVDLSPTDYTKHLNNRIVCSFNEQKGQFNLETVDHKTENIQKFAQDSILKNVLTRNSDTERLIMNKFITDGHNSSLVYSPRRSKYSRYVDGRNKLLKYYLFSNLGISFTAKGLTIRQPARFFALSKQTKNDQDHDHLVEGQYFITNVVHRFSSQLKDYSTQLTAVKTHKYQDTKLPVSDNTIIN